jgi:hypothetical protein
MEELINRGISEEQLHLIKLKEARRLDQLPSVEKAYTSSRSVQVQEEYLYKMQELQQQAGPNGEGYLDSLNSWFDERIPQILSEAPSDTAKAEMLSRLQSFRLQGIHTGIEFEEKRRKENALEQSTSAIESLAKQAMMAPENFDDYQAQAEYLKENLHAAGFSPAEADRWVRESKNRITDGFLYRAINDDPVGAIEMMSTNPALTATMSADSLMSHISTATNMFKARQKEIEIQANLAQSVAKIQSGVPLDASNAQDVKALDQFYSVVTEPMRDPNTGQFNQPPGVVAQALVNTIRTTPSLLPDKFKSDFTNGMLYGNVETAQSYARMVGLMKNDPQTAPALAKLDEKSLHMALYINDALSAGEDPAQALSDAKNQFLKLRSPAEEDRLKRAKSALTPDYINTQLDGEFTSWGGLFGDETYFVDPSNFDDAAPEYSRHFANSFLQFGDEQIADKYAKTQLHKSFAVTNVNGTNQLMSYAPEIVFPGRVNDFKRNLYKAIDPSTDGSQRPELKIDGNPVEWFIDSKDQYGVNQARENGAYPVYYIDATGYRRPLLDVDGNQSMFVYEKGLTEDEAKVIQDAREKQALVKQSHVEREKTFNTQVNNLLTVQKFQALTDEQKAIINTITGRNG